MNMFVKVRAFFSISLFYLFLGGLFLSPQVQAKDDPIEGVSEFLREIHMFLRKLNYMDQECFSKMQKSTSVVVACYARHSRRLDSHLMRRMPFLNKMVAAYLQGYNKYYGHDREPSEEEVNEFSKEFRDALSACGSWREKEDLKITIDSKTGLVDRESTYKALSYCKENFLNVKLAVSKAIHAVADSLPYLAQDLREEIRSDSVKGARLKKSGHPSRGSSSSARLSLPFGS